MVIDKKETAEQQYLHEQLAILRREYERQSQPIIDRLTMIESVNSCQMLVLSHKHIGGVVSTETSAPADTTTRKRLVEMGTLDKVIESIDRAISDYRKWPAPTWDIRLALWFIKTWLIAIRKLYKHHELSIVCGGRF